MILTITHKAARLLATADALRDMAIYRLRTAEDSFSARLVAGLGYVLAQQRTVPGWDIRLLGERR